MKKLIFTVCAFVAAHTAFAQKWEEVKLDSVMSVSLPVVRSKKDTLGQEIYTAVTTYGNIMVIKVPDNPTKTPDIEKERHLKKYYDNYLKRVSGSAPGAVIRDEKDSMIGNLKVKDFTMEVDSGSGKQLRDFRIIHENCATYTFEYLYEDIHKDLAVAEQADFFKSIKASSNPTVQSQFTTEKATAKDTKPKTIYIVIGAVVVIILIIVSILISRRKKKTA
ncbi:hypothetical protein GS399_16540 [Pedobacter sp. HMF7647]|uniref:Uncharacterized protein n=1 Tax=Hufsiella arboris TaxID=2695275 RepID=A0A7K1YDB6_9SPHI|nr:hypothetical protein [Hufsiella arboris]MXV52583.1 hypothetical protein [Hufsiella arboris]